MSPTVLDLFAGCGGMTAGFHKAGFRSVGAVEWDLSAAATYAANFDPSAKRTFWGDIADFNEIPQCDVVIGGPPCQGFSALGSRDIDDPRNKLWREYLRVVSIAKPKVFVIENVERFLKSAEFDLLREEVESGALRRYELTYGVLLTADYGVPQRRPRAIVIGSRVGTPRLPAPTHAQDRASGRRRWKTTRDAIGDLAWDVDTTTLPESRVAYFGQSLPGVFKGRDIHIGRDPRPLSLLRYDCIPPGGGRFDLPDELLPKCWRNKPTGTTDVMGRMSWDRPSLTIRTEFFKPEKGQYLHPQWDADDPTLRVNRPITHLEAARLQTFPSDFLWCGTKLQIARQIGNAVPVKFATAIAKSVAPLLG